MIKKYVKDIRREEIQVAGTKNAKMQWIFSKFDGTKTYSLRRFIINREGVIPEHSHPWEHELFILEGTGYILVDNKKYFAKPMDAIYIEKDVPHSYYNEDEKEFIFLCIIPNEGDKREIKYYTLEILEKENKVACRDCDFNVKEKCTMCYAVMAEPEDYYWTLGGSIIGCIHGEPKKV